MTDLITTQWDPTVWIHFKMDLWYWSWLWKQSQNRLNSGQNICMGILYFNFFSCFFLLHFYYVYIHQCTLYYCLHADILCWPLRIACAVILPCFTVASQLHSQASDLTSPSIHPGSEQNLLW